MPAKQRNGDAPPSADHATGRSSARLLAVTGPLDLTTLLGAIDRGRRWRRAPLTLDRLADALSAVGANEAPDGR